MDHLLANHSHLSILYTNTNRPTNDSTNSLINWNWMAKKIGLFYQYEVSWSWVKLRQVLGWNFISIVGNLSYEMEFLNIFALSQSLRQPTSTNVLLSNSSLNSVFTSAQSRILTNSRLDPTGITFNFCSRTLQLTVYQKNG